MKKIFTAFLAIVVICILLALGDVALNQQKTGGGKQTLTIYNWGDYIDPALITKFEHQTGYHVDYETFDSNGAWSAAVQYYGYGKMDYTDEEGNLNGEFSPKDITFS